MLEAAGGVLSLLAAFDFTTGKPHRVVYLVVTSVKSIIDLVGLSILYGDQTQLGG